MEAQTEPAHAGAERRRSKPRWGSRPWGAAVAIVLVAMIAALCAGGLWIAALGPPPLGRDLAYSTTVVDRDGRLLRPYVTVEGRWRLPARSESVDPRYLELLIAYEDKRFRAHAGADPLALLRAGRQFLVHGRILSGGSTLTMQVARLLEPRSERSFAAKLRQIVRAVEIERHLTKDEVLALYLSLAPYGGNLEGIRAAALAYFGKEPKRLTLGEAALLVALPQAPEARRPDRSVAAARRARDRVLDRVATAGIFDTDEIVRAKTEPVPSERRPMPMLAPHAADEAVAALPGRSRIQLTIDGPWQASLEDLARERARALGPDISIAILAVEHATGDVLARVGSADYFDVRRSGQVDMTAALRSPGSTLKPFIYGLGFEDGLVHPETLIEDRPVRYGAYAPENFDLTFQGTVTVRKALQMSLNVPAVAVLDRVGAGRFSTRLRQAGGALVLPKGETPGLAMGLGGAGVRLSDLVMLYAGLARLGTTLPLRILHETNDSFVVSIVPSPACGSYRPHPEEAAPSAVSKEDEGRDSFSASHCLTEHTDAMPQTDPGAAPDALRLMEPVAAWYVANILSGTPPPEHAPGGRVAFKTGTSYGYRDAWSVGFDGKRTVGVWVGRPDGAPVPGLVGRTAAAPILFDAFARSGKLPAALPAAPHGALFASNAKLPPPLRHFRPRGLDGSTAAANGEPPLRILFPPNGARLELAAGPQGNEPLALKIAGGTTPLTVLVNGTPLPGASARRSVFFTPDGPGFVRLTVMDANGATDSVMVRLE